MRLTSIQGVDGPRAAIVLARGKVGIDELNAAAGTDWPATIEELIRQERLDALRTWVSGEPAALDAVTVLPPESAAPASLLQRPPKILGVGLNYEDHAGDLGETRPTEPATFMKPATTIVGPGDTIPIPRQSERTTGEAELGLVIGRTCKDVSPDQAPAVIAGLTTIIDMTAEDILQRNPRFLTRAKSFDGFLVIGPDLVTVDEVHDLGAIEVMTLHNGEAHRHNVVGNMMFDPWYLVSFFSQVMTLEPGDVISTGTPGAVALADGDTVGCTVTGIGRVSNPVRDLKVAAS